MHPELYEELFNTWKAFHPESVSTFNSNPNATTEFISSNQPIQQNTMDSSLNNSTARSSGIIIPGKYNQPQSNNSYGKIEMTNSITNNNNENSNDNEPPLSAFISDEFNRLYNRFQEYLPPPITSNTNSQRDVNQRESQNIDALNDSEYPLNRPSYIGDEESVIF